MDNRRLTYVRVGISEKLPIGKEWVHVPGESFESQVILLCALFMPGKSMCARYQVCLLHVMQSSVSQVSSHVSGESVLCH